MSRRMGHIRITGGPHAKNTKVQIDDEQIKGVHSVEIKADVNDVVRVKLGMYSEITVDTDAMIEDVFRVDVVQVSSSFKPTGELGPEGEPLADFFREREVLYSGTGPTWLAALERVLEQVREVEAQEVRDAPPTP